MASSAASYTSFDGHRRIASGSLPVNALAVKRTVESGSAGPVLTFDDQTGRLVDLDLRGPESEVVSRLRQDVLPTEAEELSDSPSEPRGRGRPRLGVIAREVTLLPRHWDWLAGQPGGASVTLRKLIDEARRSHADRDRQRARQERAYHFMSALAGDLPGFEEATRALFAGDESGFDTQTGAWPDDVRQHARHLAFGSEG